MHLNENLQTQRNMGVMVDSIRDIADVVNKEKECIKTLIYVRHGKSEWNQAYEIDKMLPENNGKTKNMFHPNLTALTSIKKDIDMLLVEKGVQEAKEVGTKLVEYYDRFFPEYFFSSESIRAIDTRRYALGEMEKIYGKILQPTIKFRELDSLNEESSLGPEGHALEARVEAFLSTLDEECPQFDTVVVFGHRNWYRTFLQKVQQWTPEELKKNIYLTKLKNGQIALHQGKEWRTLKRVNE